ncbi:MULTISPECIES: RDD family protein [Pseudomonadati]|uniref:RDD family protein n=1 Tax=Pseudomonadati TaxID=3379134 RepID=UPI0023F37ED4|nr:MULTISPECIES: RDD family protein [Bacteria]MCI5968536.1 RDD family protein [Helicobacter sp.]MDD6911353.1 RDD family protein [Actinobacillus minor]MDY2584746.1 RDD family protein [Helicobacter sp.]
MRWRRVRQGRKAKKNVLKMDSESLNLESKILQNLPLKLREELGASPSKDLFYAGFLERGKAQVIDTFMLYMPLLYVLTYGVVGSAQGFRDSNWAPFAGVLLYGSIVAVFLALKRQTPGKKAYGLWIVRENGKKITFLFAILRFFGFLLSGVTIVGILLPLWRKDKKALHDILLKTLVLRKD